MYNRSMVPVNWIKILKIEFTTSARVDVNLAWFSSFSQTATRIFTVFTIITVHIDNLL